MTYDDRLIFEKHIRNIASSIAQKTGLIRKCYKTFDNNGAVLRSFYAFILPCFEYCSLVWGSATDSHLKLLDRVLNNIRFFLPDILINLEQRRNLTSLSMFYNILNNINHPLHQKLPHSANPTRITRHIANKMIKLLFWLGVTPTNSLDALPILLLNSGIVCQMRLF